MADSLVQLGSVQWDIDPESYTPMQATRRGSVHRVLPMEPGQPGSTIYQDRGIDPTDHVILLNGMFYSDATATALWALYRKIGAEHTFSDFKGNVLQVVFTPGAEFVCEPVRGSNVGWRYRVSLSVVSITTWFGGTYPAVT